MTPIVVVSKEMKRFPDGHGQIVLEIEPEDINEASAIFMGNRKPAILTGTPYARYGDEAKALRLSKFFRMPKVWEAIGTDAQYQAWTRQQKCVVSKRQDRDVEKGENRCTYCHVRRAGNSGTGFKPEFMGVPMIDELHRLQHQSGELAVLAPQGVNSIDEARAWFDREALRHVQRWAWETLKAHLGFAHWNDVPPRVLCGWAKTHGVESYLPECYQQ